MNHHAAALQRFNRSVLCSGLTKDRFRFTFFDRPLIWEDAHYPRRAVRRQLFPYPQLAVSLKAAVACCAAAFFFSSPRVVVSRRLDGVLHKQQRRRKKEHEMADEHTSEDHIRLVMRSPFG